MAMLVERPVAEQKRGRGRPRKTPDAVPAPVEKSVGATEEKVGGKMSGSIVVPKYISEIVNRLSAAAGCGSNAEFLDNSGFFEWLEIEDAELADRLRENAAAARQRRKSEGKTTNGPFPWTAN